MKNKIWLNIQKLYYSFLGYNNYKGVMSSSCLVLPSSFTDGMLLEISGTDFYNGVWKIKNEHT